MAQTAIQPTRRRRRSKAQQRRRHHWNCIRLTVALILVLVGGIILRVGMLKQTICSVTPEVSQLTGYLFSKEDTETQNENLTQAEKLQIIQTEDGYPERLVELAEKNEETVDFVYQYPTLSQQHPKIDLSEEAKTGGIPLLLQWDSRWGCEAYGDGLMAYTGCCPTSLSMVAIGLRRDAQWTPLAVAQYADEQGYYVNGAGSAWTLVSEGCAGLGLQAEVLPLDEGRMKQALDSGKPIILNVGPGDFTDSGHFLVVTGYTEQGFTVNDPNSQKNSDTIWSYDTLKGQIRNLWAMSLAE